MSVVGFKWTIPLLLAMTINGHLNALGGGGGGGVHNRSLSRGHVQVGGSRYNISLTRGVLLL